MLALRQALARIERAVESRSSVVGARAQQALVRALITSAGEGPAGWTAMGAVAAWRPSAPMPPREAIL